MNDETVLEVINDYFHGRASNSEYQQALDYLTTISPVRSRLAELYRELTATDCDECEQTLVRYLDPIERSLMTLEERETFLLQLTRCSDCAEQYMELGTFEEAAVLDDEPIDFDKL